MEMTIEQQIKKGCDVLIHESAQTSEGEPNMAIAQLLLSAAILAKTIEMTDRDFIQGVNLAMEETFYRDD
jgi:hypothetical protein